MDNKINPLNLCNKRLTIGTLPTSYLQSLSYEEQLLLIGKHINEIDSFINTILEQKISDYINTMFNDMIINTMYEADTETLILYLDKKSN